MPKEKKRRRWIIWLVIAVVVIGGILYISAKAKNALADLATGYESKTAALGEIQVMVNGSGAVESKDSETLYVDYASEVKDVIAEDGDTVNAGDVIAVLESDTLDDAIDAQRTAIDNMETSIQYEDTDDERLIESVVQGRVKAVYVKEDDDVQDIIGKFGSLIVISVDDKMKATMKVDNLDIYKLGDEMEVFMDGVSEDATIEGIDPLTNEITLVFTDNKDEEYEIGDTAIIKNADGVTLAQGVLEVNHPYYVLADEGKIGYVRVRFNSWVDKGDLIIRLDRGMISGDYTYAVDKLNEMHKDLDEMEAAKEALVVRAPVSGVISGLDINKGQYLQQGQTICTVEGNTTLKILVDIDELDIAKIALNQSAEVTIDALSGGVYSATVSAINPIGVSVNNVTHYVITLDLPASPEILLGMSADVDILAEDKTDALLIPLTAVQTINNKYYVMLASEIGTTDVATHEVTIGVTDGVNVEILSGLSEGDAVAVPTELSDTMKMMMGGSTSSSTDTFATGD